MAAGYRSQQGYLVLADISGYTAFLTGTEIEHAQGIIHELTTLIRECLAPPMRFVKLEGDAVFCYANEAAFPEGERLVELLEVCYFDFSNRLINMARAATCHCTACASIDALGLKFIAHFGSYVVQHDAGSEDLAGADVILAHRLLKNTISDADGPQAYAFFTGACLEHLPLSFALPAHAETYESFGETAGGVHDFGPVLREMRESRRDYIGSADADFEVSFEVPAPPALVWGYYVDPLERWRWEGRSLHKNPDEDEPNGHGRTGMGATSHCSHALGAAMREYVDWRPYSYFTNRTTSRFCGAFITAGRITETIEFAPTDDGGTVVTMRIRLTDRGGFSKLTFIPARLAFKPASQTWHANLLNMIEEDAAVRESSGPPEGLQPSLENA